MKLFAPRSIVYQSSAASFEDREQFRRNQLSVLDEIKHTNRRAGRAIWTCASLMGCWSAALFAGAAYLAPMLQKRVEMHWIIIDRTAPYIQEIPGVENVKKAFSDANAENEIREYLEYYYDYSWETNRKHEDRIGMMSSGDQLARYKAWADGDPNSPKQKLAHHGSGETDHILFYKQSAGDAETQEYLIKFAYRETANGRTDPAWHYYTGHIQFQWHPELVNNSDWVSKNPGGFYVTYFKADEDPR